MFKQIASEAIGALGIELKCAICLSSYHDPVSLSCNHTFCRECILQSLRRKECCPECRSPATRRSIQKSNRTTNLLHAYKLLAVSNDVELSQDPAAFPSEPIFSPTRAGNFLRKAPAKKMDSPPLNDDDMDTQRIVDPKDLEIMELDAVEDPKPTEAIPENEMDPVVVGKEESNALKGFTETKKVKRKKQATLERFVGPVGAVNKENNSRTVAPQDTCTRNKGSADGKSPAKKKKKVERSQTCEKPARRKLPLADSEEASSSTKVGSTPGVLLEPQEAGKKSRKSAKEKKAKGTPLPQDSSPKVVDADPSSLAMEEDICCVCFDGDSLESDPIVFCDGGCGIAVHQSCYGIDRVPEGSWICRHCEHRKETGRMNICCLCPCENGALWPTDNGTWAHLSCALWIPETVVDRDAGLIRNIEGMDKRRWSMKCTVCGTKDGATAQCHIGSCTKAFHVACAQKAGYLVDFKEKKDGDITRIILCGKHTEATTGKPLKPILSKDQTRSKSSCRPKKGAASKKTSTPMPKSTSASAVVEAGKERKPCASNNVCIVPTGLSQPQMAKLEKMVSQFGWKLSKKVTPQATHVVAKTTVPLTATRTLKYVAAVAAGIWVLGFDWVLRCLAEDQHANEEEFEVLHDSLGFHGGARRARLAKQDAGSIPLFHNFNFYIPKMSNDNISPDELKGLIEKCGGRVIPKPPVPKFPSFANNKAESTGFASPPQSKYIVICADEQGVSREHQRKAYSDDVDVVTYRWVLDSISQYQPVEVAPYSAPAV